MPKFRKKPVTVNAFKFRYESMPDWFCDAVTANEVRLTHDCCFINTLEGSMQCNWGDIVIQGVEGEIYPCNPDIFEATYEAV